MQGTQMGARRAGSGTPWMTVFTVLIAIAIVGVIAYFAIAGSYGGSSPTPYNTAAPATGAPATGAPATAPGAPNYP